MPDPNGKRLIGLCSLAVAAVYAAGYLYTQPSMQANAGSSPLPPSSASAVTHPVKRHPVHKHKIVPKKAALYKDGTYTGSGSNPYGTLSVAVHIRSGKIASAQITSYQMHYSQAYIDPQLPQETVSMQTWRIYIVSGATASSYNYAEAVYYALKKARA